MLLLIFRTLPWKVKTLLIILNYQIFQQYPQWWFFSSTFNMVNQDLIPRSFYHDKAGLYSRCLHTWKLAEFDATMKKSWNIKLCRGNPKLRQVAKLRASTMLKGVEKKSSLRFWVQGTRQCTPASTWTSMGPRAQEGFSRSYRLFKIPQSHSKNFHLNSFPVYKQFSSVSFQILSNIIIYFRYYLFYFLSVHIYTILCIL